MAPNLTGWSHPYRDPFTVYADGADDPAPEPTVAVEPEPDEPADDWTPPSREEYEKLVEGKRKADAEAASRRKYLRQHGIDPKTGNKVDPDPEPDPEPAAKDDRTQGPSPAEIKRQVDKAAAEAELRGLRKTKALVTGVNGALADAGWNGQRLNSLMKLIDLDEVEVDDEGEITGLSEQIDAIKGEWPEFFKRTRSANPSNGAGGSGQNGVTAAKVDAADKKPPAPEPKDWASRLAERALRS